MPCEADCRWMVGSGRSTGHRRLHVNRSAAGVSQSHPDVSDDRNHVHHRLAAVPAQPTRLFVRRRRPRATGSTCRQDPSLPQLVRQSSGLRAYVETLPRVAHPGRPTTKNCSLLSKRRGR